jgi:hypothetical protein
MRPTLGQAHCAVRDLGSIAGSFGTGDTIRRCQTEGHRFAVTPRREGWSTQQRFPEGIADEDLDSCCLVLVGQDRSYRKH